jgi:hypothetical protein
MVPLPDPVKCPISLLLARIVSKIPAVCCPMQLRMIGNVANPQQFYAQKGEPLYLHAVPVLG